MHRIDLKAQAKPFDKVKIKAIYEYKNYDQPAYNTTPDKSNLLKLTTIYTPSSALNIYLEYLLALTESDSLSYLDIDSPVPLERDGKRDHFLASLTTGLTPKLSLTASWYYQRGEIEQDLVFAKVPDDVPPYYIDFGVPYTDKANSFSFALHWVPRNDFTVAADLGYTIAEGTTGYTVMVEGEPVSSFSDVETTETSFSLDMAKKLPKDWEAGLKLYLDIYNDKPTGYQDGNVFTATFSMKRYF